jgi:AraC family transcriptional regulator
MDGQIHEMPARSHEWMNRVISLLEAAVAHLHNQVHPAQSALMEAASLLRLQIDHPPTQIVCDAAGRLLAWQARKVRDYIDSHIAGPILVADLCALVKRSEAHFSRSFRVTFGHSPHAFVIRRRVELAADDMLQTDKTLSQIAIDSGFVDQAHLCKQFRSVTGETPAAWRRARTPASLRQQRALLDSKPLSPGSPVPGSARPGMRS